MYITYRKIDNLQEYIGKYLQIETGRICRFIKIEEIKQDNKEIDIWGKGFSIVFNIANPLVIDTIEFNMSTKSMCTTYFCNDFEEKIENDIITDTTYQNMLNNVILYIQKDNKKANE